MTPAGKAAGVLGAVTGAGILALAIAHRPAPPATSAARATPVPTAALGFRRTFASIPNVSAPLVQFEPVAGSSVPRGVGNIAVAPGVLLVQHAYGYDVYSLTPAPSFRFGVKSPYPPNGDGQETVTRLAISSDGARIVAATHRTTHATLVYDSKFHLAGEFGSAWSTATGVLAVDGKVAYSISASGTWRADLTTLQAASGVYDVTRLTAPANSSMPSDAGFAAGALWYSSGAAVQRLDTRTLAVTSFSSAALGFAPSQLRGLAASGESLLVEAMGIDGASRGVALCHVGEGVTVLRVWIPPATSSGFVGASALSPSGHAYVWERSDRGAQLFEDFVPVGAPLFGLDPKQMIVTDNAIYVATAAGTWWMPLGGAPPGPTATVPPEPTRTPPLSPTMTPGATRTPLATRTATLPPVVSTPPPFALACPQDQTHACLSRAIPVQAWVDDVPATIDVVTSISVVWGAGSDRGLVTVKYDQIRHAVAVGSLTGRRVRVVVAEREIPASGLWVQL